MPASCKVCIHPKRLAIDRKLVQGHGVSALAREYKLKRHQLDWHLKHHVTRQLQTAVAIREKHHGENLANDLFDLLQRAQNILDTAEDQGKLGLALKGISESRATIETLAKIAALIKDHGEEEKRKQEDEAAHDFLRHLSEVDKVIYFWLLNKGQQKDEVHNQLTEKQWCEHYDMEPDGNGGYISKRDAGIVSMGGAFPPGYNRERGRGYEMQKEKILNYIDKGKEPEAQTIIIPVKKKRQPISRDSDFDSDSDASLSDEESDYESDSDSDSDASDSDNVSELDFGSDSTSELDDYEEG